MDALVIPSGEVPGPAAVSVELPEGWSATPAPGVTAIALAPEIEGRFRPNIVLTHARMPAASDLAVIAGAGRQVVEALPDFVGEPDSVVSIGGRPTIVREFAFRDTDSGLGLYQLQVQALMPVGFDLADLVTLSGTCSGSELEFVPVLRAIADSLRGVPDPTAA